jgi:hypothetical protein
MFQTFLLLASEDINYCCIEQLLNNILICFMFERTGRNFLGRLNVCGKHICYTIKCRSVWMYWRYLRYLQYIHILLQFGTHCSILLCNSCVRHLYSVYPEESHQFFHICSRSKYCLVTVLYNSNN